ncbi:MAG: hypothetical protein HYV77_04540 [Candidatus Wildermuthbacteria bacterium]|nr:hypothetical protein [Candidatus Wildermuthbacteria bacterium]
MNTQELLTSSQIIVLSLPDRPTQEDLTRAFSVFCGLKQLGKSIGVEETIPGKTLLPSHIQKEQGDKTFALILRNIASHISKVYYEKDRNDLKLYFTLSDGSLEKENISLQKLHAADLTIIVGDRTLPDNAGSGNRIIGATEASDVILKNLLVTDVPALALASRIFSGLERIPGTSLHMGIVTPQDFSATGTSPKLLVPVISQFKNCIGSGNSYLLVYMPDSSLQPRGVLWSTSSDLRDQILRTLKGESKESWVLFSFEQMTLDQAKQKLTATLSPLWNKA